MIVINEKYYYIVNRTMQSFCITKFLMNELTVRIIFFLYKTYFI